MLGAIALQGVRLARLGLGDTAFVIGLGLVGQITVALLKAQGCRVLGTDPDSDKCDLALKMGADLARPGLNVGEVMGLTHGLGADAVLITASTKSDGPVELAGIEAALEEAMTNSILMVGFNRRFSPAALLVKQFFLTVASPLTVSVRFNAGEIPPEHWTQDDAIGGGRIIGEACHAIDLATYLVGAPPVRVFAESNGGPAAQKITDDQCFITLGHANGSVSSVAYLAGGDKAFPKELVEVLGGGRLAVIDDFREVTTCFKGKIRKRRLAGQDKGHRGEIEVFARAMAEGGVAPIPWEELRAVTMASILAVRSIREGVPFEI